MIVTVDTREKWPYLFQDYPVDLVTATLTTGDYSLRGMEDQVCIERKTLNDFVGSICRGRERFERELLRMKAYELGVVIIEASMSDIVAQRYRSKMSSGAVAQTIFSWANRYGVHFHLANNRKLGEFATYGFLQKFLRHKEKQLQALQIHQLKGEIKDGF